MTYVHHEVFVVRLKRRTARATEAASSRRQGDEKGGVVCGCRGGSACCCLRPFLARKGPQGSRLRRAMKVTDHLGDLGCLLLRGREGQVKERAWES
jgi:hypothetical protein